MDEMTLVDKMSKLQTIDELVDLSKEIGMPLSYNDAEASGVSIRYMGDDGILYARTGCREDCESPRKRHTHGFLDES